MKNQNSLLIEVPLGVKAHRFASQFAAEQATNQKGKDVYLNTLTVYGVHRYLQWLKVKTDLRGSDSWHPVLRSQWNVADLVIPGTGKLECCPFLPGETTFVLAPEVTEDRIGYVAVQFGECLDKVQLLGFAKTGVAGVLKISQLQPLEDLIDEISIVNLREWLENIYGQEWKSPLELLQKTRSTVAKDSRKRSISRGKVIRLGSGDTAQAIVLIIQISNGSQEEMDICLRVFPFENKTNHLPLSLQVTVLEESGAVYLEKTAGTTDNFIEHKFKAKLGEGFSVRLSLKDIIYTENFIA